MASKLMESLKNKGNYAQAHALNLQADRNVLEMQSSHPYPVPQTEPVVIPEGEKEYIYSTPLSHAWGIDLSDGLVRAKDGVLRVNQKQHDEIQMLIKKHKRYDISQNAILLDVDAAEKVAREYLEKNPPIPDAKKGAISSAGTTTAHMQNLDGHMLPNALAELEVVDLDVHHAEDSNQDPK